MVSRGVSRIARFFALAALAALLLPAAPALAQWTGKGQLGAALATGNDDTLNASGKANVKHTHGNWQETLGLNGVYASSDSQVTSQMWELTGDARYGFSERSFWFGGARYQADRFSGFRNQGSVSTGVGHKFIDTDRTKLQGRVGVGFKFQQTRDTIDPLTGAPIRGTTGHSMAGVGGLDWDFKATSTTTLYDYFYVESGSQNTFFRNETGMSVAMSERLALALSYTVRYNTSPPIGFKDTDTLLTANLVYEVK
jgi:putative salt-induced outer membrane protein